MQSFSFLQHSNCLQDEIKKSPHLSVHDLKYRLIQLGVSVPATLKKKEYYVQHYQQALSQNWGQVQTVLHQKQKEEAKRQSEMQTKMSKRQSLYDSQQNRKLIQSSINTLSTNSSSSMTNGGIFQTQDERFEIFKQKKMEIQAQQKRASQEEKMTQNEQSKFYSKSHKYNDENSAQQFANIQSQQSQQYNGNNSVSSSNNKIFKNLITQFNNTIQKDNSSISPESKQFGQELHNLKQQSSYSKIFSDNDLIFHHTPHQNTKNENCISNHLKNNLERSAEHEIFQNENQSQQIYKNNQNSQLQKRFQEKETNFVEQQQQNQLSRQSNLLNQLNKQVQSRQSSQQSIQYQSPNGSNKCQSQIRAQGKYQKKSFIQQVEHFITRILIKFRYFIIIVSILSFLLGIYDISQMDSRVQKEQKSMYAQFPHSYPVYLNIQKIVQQQGFYETENIINDLRDTYGENLGYLIYSQVKQIRENFKQFSLVFDKNGREIWSIQHKQDIVDHDNKL